MKTSSALSLISSTTRLVTVTEKGDPLLFLILMYFSIIMTNYVAFRRNSSSLTASCAIKIVPSSSVESFISLWCSISVAYFTGTLVIRETTSN